MKILRRFSFFVWISILIVLSVDISDGFGQARNSTEISEFLFVIEAVDDKVSLSCMEGCAWKVLGFKTSSGNNPQHIDQYGMTIQPKNNTAIKSDKSDLANFLFTLERTKNRIKLEGKAGSAWNNLSFLCPEDGCNQAIDQYGMAASRP